MADKLFKRLHNRQGSHTPSEDLPRYNGDGENSDHGSLMDRSEPSVAKDSTDSYAHSYYSTIREMGLPIENPNHNARNKYLKRQQQQQQQQQEENRDLHQDQRDGFQEAQADEVGGRFRQSNDPHSATYPNNTRAGKYHSKTPRHSRTTSTERESQQEVNPKQRKGSHKEISRTSGRVASMPGETSTRAAPPGNRSSRRASSPSKKQQRMSSPTMASRRRYPTLELEPSPDGDAEWTKLLDWLNAVKLKKYAGLFKRNGTVTLAMVEKLSAFDLVEIGISANDSPILQLKIKELRHRTFALSKRRSLADSSSSSCSDANDDYWDRVSHSVTGGNTQRSSSAGSQGGHARYGGPSAVSSTVAAARLGNVGMTQNFFEHHGRGPSSVRQPDQVKLHPREKMPSFAEFSYSSRSGRQRSPSRIRYGETGGSESPTRRSAQGRLSSPTSSSRHRYLSPDNLRPRRGENLDVNAMTLKDSNEEWHVIRDWLDEVKLSRYSGLFLRSGMTKINYVRALTIPDLAQMGIHHSDHSWLLLSTKKLTMPSNEHMYRSSGSGAGIQSHSSSPHIGVNTRSTVEMRVEASAHNFMYYNMDPSSQLSADVEDVIVHDQILSKLRSRSAPRHLGAHDDVIRSSRSTPPLSGREFMSRSAGQSGEAYVYQSQRQNSYRDYNAPSADQKDQPETQKDDCTDFAPSTSAAPEKYSCVKQILQAFWDGDESLFYSVWNVVVSDLICRRDVNIAVIRASHLLELFTRVYFVTWPQRFQVDPHVADTSGARGRFRRYVDRVLAETENYSSLLSSREFVTFVGIGMLPDASSNAMYSYLFKQEWVSGLAKRLETFTTFVASSSLNINALEDQRNWIPPMDDTCRRELPQLYSQGAEGAFVLGGEGTNSSRDRSNGVISDVAGNVSVRDLNRHVDNASYKLDGKLYIFGENSSRASSFSDGAPLPTFHAETSSVPADNNESNTRVNDCNIFQSRELNLSGGMNQSSEASCVARKATQLDSIVEEVIVVEHFLALDPAAGHTDIIHQNISLVSEDGVVNKPDNYYDASFVTEENAVDDAADANVVFAPASPPSTLSGYDRVTTSGSYDEELTFISNSVHGAVPAAATSAQFPVVSPVIRPPAVLSKAPSGPSPPAAAATAVEETDVDGEGGGKWRIIGSGGESVRMGDTNDVAPPIMAEID